MECTTGLDSNLDLEDIPFIAKWNHGMAFVCVLTSDNCDEINLLLNS
jgi:hypothetical protein